MQIIMEHHTYNLNISRHYDGVLTCQPLGWAMETGDSGNSHHWKFTQDSSLCLHVDEESVWAPFFQNQPEDLSYSACRVEFDFCHSQTEGVQWACKFERKENSNQLWRTDVDRDSFFLMQCLPGQEHPDLECTVRKASPPWVPDMTRFQISNTL